MRTARLATFVALILIFAGLVVPAIPAAAHGTCTRTVSVPVAGSGTINASGSVNCVDGHTYYFIRVCLEFSSQPSIDPWSNTECHDSVWNSTSRTSWSGGVTEQCAPFPTGYWRAKMTSTIGTGSGHSTTTQYSGQLYTACLP